MNYKHLTIEERCCLREYYKKGYSYRKIAELMGRNVSTISRELNRNFMISYSSVVFFKGNECLIYIYPSFPDAFYYSSYS